ncbi:TetR/AcrR family transcriptional regulator [Bacillus sp. 03113]|uniref:TetR/AcrR family transcriptional regulator n=1 Tax=Bacillus sp. 03113 TaxID=2578211 RepID=UPI0015E88424|nr:TetR/AcrR family transcriptional regulator [Bacillus sp. 03113]
MRGFTEQEKATIHLQLLEKGRELFSSLGLKKTSIKDLTEGVGIAQGSFYLFFQSKEELYFRILEAEEEAIKESLLNYLSASMTVEDIKVFLIKGIQLIKENSLIQRLYFEGEYEKMVRKLPKEIVEAHIQQDNDLLEPLLEHWGIQKKENRLVISGAIRAYFTMSIHEKEIGKEQYNQVLEFMAEAIAVQLIKEKELEK